MFVDNHCEGAITCGVVELKAAGTYKADLADSFLDLPKDTVPDLAGSVPDNFDLDVVFHDVLYSFDTH
jgi:hypothetical protein